MQYHNHHLGLFFFLPYTVCGLCWKEINLDWLFWPWWGKILAESLFWPEIGVDLLYRCKTCHPPATGISFKSVAPRCSLEDNSVDWRVIWLRGGEQCHSINPKLIFIEPERQAYSLLQAGQWYLPRKKWKKPSILWLKGRGLRFVIVFDVKSP